MMAAPFELLREDFLYWFKRAFGATAVFGGDPRRSRLPLHSQPPGSGFAAPYGFPLRSALRATPTYDRRHRRRHSVTNPNALTYKPTTRCYTIRPPRSRIKRPTSCNTRDALRACTHHRSNHRPLDPHPLQPTLLRYRIGVFPWSFPRDFARKRLCRIALMIASAIACTRNPIMRTSPTTSPLLK